jgi:hypothetical protein
VVDHCLTSLNPDPAELSRFGTLRPLCGVVTAKAMPVLPALFSAVAKRGFAEYL